MDKSAFFDFIRHNPFNGLDGSQVGGIEAILDEAERRKTRRRHLAYILATPVVETDRKMQPIEEYGRGKGRRYGVPAGPYGHIYYGRGYVQLTWLENYRHAGEAIGVDLVQFPEKALEPDIAAKIMFEGMEHGWFTGKKLSDYLDGENPDWVDARRIINRLDRAGEIGGYAARFNQALKVSAYA